MKNGLIALALALLLNVEAKSQQQLSIGVNTGPVGRGYLAILSPDARFQSRVGNRFSILVTAGYINFKPNFIHHEQGYQRHELIPLKAGTKYFFNGSGTGCYGLAEAGAAFSTGAKPTVIAGRAKIRPVVVVFSPALGYAWRNRMDLALKYEGYAKDIKLGYIGLRLAYGFRI